MDGVGTRVVAPDVVALDVVIRGVREPRDGEALRVLVDRLWPRGVSKDAADLDLWPKELTPSTELRKAMHAGDLTFDEFAERYRAELAAHGDALDELRASVAQAGGPCALLLAGDASRLSHATVLRELLLGDGGRVGDSVGS